MVCQNQRFRYYSYLLDAKMLAWFYACKLKEGIWGTDSPEECSACLETPSIGDTMCRLPLGMRPPSVNGNLITESPAMLIWTLEGKILTSYRQLVFWGITV
ncbi:hypothetical protein DCAR_0830852 [Daucus carota subsp. sativus]|uniref:Uncharacterized protein n=1 Tax=Daucus carota subsp. sativus TaxID=79200 RepID=A0A175YLX1_DAUCS|nr:hypothetical protein DCAR_0830852 [Daucus carota subsp. sativus]